METLEGMLHDKFIQAMFVKFLIDISWCYVGLQFIFPSSLTIIKVLKYGCLRMLLGFVSIAIVGGALAAILVGLEKIFKVSEFGGPKHTIEFIVMALSHLTAWFLTACYIKKQATGANLHGKWIIYLWIFTGTALSFLTDSSLGHM